VSLYALPNWTAATGCYWWKWARMIPAEAWLFNQGVLSCSAGSQATPHCLDEGERLVDLPSKDSSRGQRRLDNV